MIIDSHCHLNYEPMSNALNETISRANKDGIKYMLTISTEDKSFEQILQIVNNFKSVYGTYGIHPHVAKSHQYIKSVDIINKVNQNKKIIGVGETGFVMIITIVGYPFGMLHLQLAKLKAVSF